MNRKFSTVLALVLGAVLLFSTCSKQEGSDSDAKDKATTKGKRSPKPRPVALADSLQWKVSTISRSRPENNLKTARKKEDVPPITLKALFEKAVGFRELVEPIGPEDSVVKFKGFDFHYFVPSMDLFDDPSSYALYRRGDDKQPAAVAIYDSIGPNNAEVFPFYWENTVIYFFHYFGTDVAHSDRKIIPGFFVNDFDGEGAAYFQPHASQDQLNALEDCGAIMLLTKTLQPDRQITLDHMQVLTSSRIKYKDTIQVEDIADFRYGKRCDFEFLSEEMVYQDLLDFINRNNCGGGDREIRPRMSNQALPLWVVGPGYAFEVLEERKPQRVSERDSITAWLVHSSGKNWRKPPKDAPDISLSKLIASAKAKAPLAARPKAGERLFVGSGWDLKGMCVDTDKPGRSLRYAIYHERKDGSPDFISLIDSMPHGIGNLECYPYYIGGAVVYFLDYFGSDPLHSNAQRVPGFFVYSEGDKHQYYFMPTAGKATIASVADIGAIVELQNELHPRKAVLFEKQKPLKRLEYRYGKASGKDQAWNGLRVTDLTVGDRECLVKSLNGKVKLSEALDFVRKGRCGKRLDDLTPKERSSYVPVWLEGTGLESIQKKAPEEKSEKEGKEIKATS